MSTRGALAVLAGVVLAIGLLLAVLPTSVSGDVGCGSALSPDSADVSTAELGSNLKEIYGIADEDAGNLGAMCEDRVTTQRLIAFPIAGIGVLALAFLALTSKGKPVSEPLERSDP